VFVIELKSATRDLNEVIESGGRSVGIVRSRTKGHGVFFFFCLLERMNTLYPLMC
jgi:hypothetical protein